MNNKLKQIDLLVEEAYEKINLISIDANAVRQILTDLAKRSAEIDEKDFNDCWQPHSREPVIITRVKIYNARLLGDEKEDVKGEEDIDPSTPRPLKADDPRVLINGLPVKVDFRIVAEDYYQKHFVEQPNLHLLTDRFFVDERGGCIAVRDKMHPKYDLTCPGLHETTPDVIFYGNGYRENGVGWWKVSELTRKKANEVLAHLQSLNFDIPSNNLQPLPSVDELENELATLWGKDIAMIVRGVAKYLHTKYGTQSNTLQPLPDEIPPEIHVFTGSPGISADVWRWMKNKFGIPSNNLQPLPEKMPAWVNSAIIDVIRGVITPTAFYMVLCQHFGVKPREWWKELKNGDKFMFHGFIKTFNGKYAHIEGNYYLYSNETNTIGLAVEHCSPYIEPTPFRDKLSPELQQEFDELINQLNNDTTTN